MLEMMAGRELNNLNGAQKWLRLKISARSDLLVCREPPSPCLLPLCRPLVSSSLGDGCGGN